MSATKIYQKKNTRDACITYTNNRRASLTNKKNRDTMRRKTTGGSFSAPWLSALIKKEIADIDKNVDKPLKTWRTYVSDKIKFMQEYPYITIIQINLAGSYIALILALITLAKLIYVSEAHPELKKDLGLALGSCQTPGLPYENAETHIHNLLHEIQRLKQEIPSNFAKSALDEFNNTANTSIHDVLVKLAKTVPEEILMYDDALRPSNKRKRARTHRVKLITA